MAEDKKKRVRKAASTSKREASPKKKTTMRAQAAKNRASADKPKRVRKAASAAVKPVGSIGKALTTDYNLHDTSKDDNFFTKRRTLTPKYFSNAWKELRQVTWPGRRETWRLVFAVFLFSVVMGTSIAVLDYGLEKLLREVIL